MIAETARISRRILLVWTPDSPRYVTAWEVPFLESGLRERSRVTLRQRAQVAGLMLIMLAGLATAMVKSHEFPMYAATAVFMGLLPLAWALNSLRRLNKGLLDATSNARLTRFLIWMRRRPHTSAWILGGCLVLAGAWQLIVGLYRSVNFAGHQKILVAQGEPWRLLTAGFVHAGVLHFLLNFLALFTLARLAETLSSGFHVVIVFLASILAGSVASQLLNSDAFSVGSSGGILGILGFLAVFASLRPNQLPPTVRNGIILMILGVVALGAFAPGLIDNAGHAGGFIVGALSGWVLLSFSHGAIPLPAGRVLRALGFFSIAIVIATCLALPFTPRSDTLYKSQNLIAVLTAEKDPEYALRIVNRAVLLKPDEPAGYVTRGIIRCYLGEYSGAVEDLTRALKTDPNLVAAYITRSSARRELGDLKGALADSDEALKRESNNLSAAEARWRALERLGEIEEALREVDRAIASRTQDGNLRVWRAWYLILLRRFDEALKECETALSLSPGSAYAVNTRGMAKAGKRDYDGAILDYSEAIKKDPEHPFAFSNRGDAKLEKGDLPGALEDYGTALKRDPEDSEALFGRGRVRRLSGDVPAARADFKDALRLASPGWYRRAEAEAALRALQAE